MKRFFSINRNQISIFITLLIVLLAGAGYLFIYIPENEKKIQEQRFRTLQRIDKNIHEKVNNSISLMGNILYAYEQTGTLKERVQDYLKTTVNNFRLSCIDTVKNDTIKQIDVNEEQRRFTVTKLSKQDITLKISMTYDVDTFIVSLLPKNIFDQYVIFGKDDIIYQTFNSGISLKKERTALKDSAGITGPLMTHQTMGGVDYKIFLHPIAFDTSYQWVVAGLLSDKKYNDEKKQLPAGLELFFITIALAMFIVFPWMKLLLMGNTDRLTFADGALSLLSAMLLMSLLFFMFFRYDNFFRPKEPDRENSARNLANQINNAFKAEVNIAYDQLNAFDNLIQSDSFKTDIRGVGKPELRLSNQYATKNELTLPYPKSNAINFIAQKIDFVQVYWLNNNGVEIYNWTRSSNNDPHGNYALKRNYFNMIIKDKSYINNNRQKFYLDQVYSWTSGKFRTVISKPSLLGNDEKKVVAALSFNVKSLDTVIMPAGYSFVITDDRANVLYHSDQTRNLNENLLEEFSEPGKLQNALTAHSKKVFTTNYYDDELVARVQPIRDLPYFIVILSDTSFKETRDTEIFSFTFSMFLVFFIFIIAEIYVSIFAFYKQCKLPKKHLIAGLLGPGVSSHEAYKTATCFNVVLVFLLIILFNWLSFAAYYFFLLTAITLSIFSQNFLTSKNERHSYARNVEKENGMAEGTNHFIKDHRKLLLCVAFFAILINIPALSVLDNYIGFLALEIAVIALFFLIYYLFRRQIFAKFFTDPKKFYICSYTFMSITRFIIIAGIPIIFLYKTSYNYEQQILVRHRQLDFANRILDKFPNTGDTFFRTDPQEYTRAIYRDGIWIKNYADDSCTKCFAKGYSKEDTITAKILNIFRYNMNSIAMHESDLYFPNAIDSSFYYNDFVNENGKGKEHIIYKQTRFKGKTLTVTSDNLNYHFPSVFKFREFLFWICLLASLSVFYLIVRLIIKKAHALYLPDLEKDLESRKAGSYPWSKFSEAILETPSLNKLVFIIGLPGSRKLFCLMRKIQDGEIKTSMEKNNGEPEKLIYSKDDPKNNNVYIADFIHIPDVEKKVEESRDAKIYWFNPFIQHIRSAKKSVEQKKWDDIAEEAKRDQYKCIIIDHFDYNIKNMAANRVKLNFIEQLMVEQKKMIIILSTVNPFTFLSALMDEETEKPEDAMIFKQELERWADLLGHYRTIIKSFQSASHIDKNESKIDPCVEQTIINETKYTHYLNDIKGALINSGSNATTESILGTIELSAYHFYQYIWQSLTKQEKFIIYDLAEDGLVNSFDSNTLTMLIRKGIIVRTKDNTLELFNKSFRNFIIKTIGQSEALKIRKEIQDKGQWNKIKGPLVIVFLAVLAILLISQQDLYSRVIGFLGTITTGIGVLLGLVAAFDRTGRRTQNPGTT